MEVGRPWGRGQRRRRLVVGPGGGRHGDVAGGSRQEGLVHAEGGRAEEGEREGEER